MKRPFFMTDQDCDYMEPSRLRPRLDYSDPAVPFRTPRYQVSTRIIIMALIMAKAHIQLFTGVVAHMEVAITTRFERLRYLRRWDGRGLVEDCGLLLERNAEISLYLPFLVSFYFSVFLVKSTHSCLPLHLSFHSLFSLSNFQT